MPEISHNLLFKEGISMALSPFKRFIWGIPWVAVAIPYHYWGIWGAFAGMAGLAVISTVGIVLSEHARQRALTRQMATGWTPFDDLCKKK